MDGNDDGKTYLTDPIFVLEHIFLGGGEPPPPFPNPGLARDGGSGAPPRGGGPQAEKKSSESDAEEYLLVLVDHTPGQEWIIDLLCGRSKEILTTWLRMESESGSPLEVPHRLGRLLGNMDRREVPGSQEHPQHLGGVTYVKT
jgi:hypothetical protein